MHDGKISYDKFDYQYFDHSLGRQGNLALQELKTELIVSAPEKAVMIDRMFINHENIAEDDLTLNISIS
ncbi:hypothetical protein FGD67_19270 [Colwellia sp. M166]|uniref:hypothetical protein n=1 Tax=Colwellia sp. M166 TaxID=2583805 RepID=UPI00211EE6F6|nr:hypothetical protein [Colwellia sp. M166]UUO25108.1 hypothetical protein FGD67_19270 [Colwellia sp. M166]